MNDVNERDATGAPKRPRKVLFFFLSPAIIILSVLIAVIMVKTKPKARRQAPGERVTQVTLSTLQSASERIVLRAAGTVVPAQQVSLKPRVSGEVVWLSPKFIPGGRFDAGDELLRIDDSDYGFVVETRKAELAQAELAYKLELGQQDIARYEWNLIGDRSTATAMDEELSLRQPHLKSAKAKLESAKAALERAELDLARTRIQAPFNGVVLSRDVDVGEQVSAQAQLGALAGADEYWIEATLPVDQLRWVEVPDPAGAGGASAKVRPAGGVRAAAEWDGRVIEVKPDLESKGRLAQLLVSVRDPLDRAARPNNEIPLLIGAYVNLEMDGPSLDGLHRLPAAAIHDGRMVWIMADGRLEFRPVEILWRDADAVLISGGLTNGERAVVSGIAAPVPGMRLEEEHALTISAGAKTAGAHEP